MIIAMVPPLLYAAQAGQTASVQFLLEQGANPNEGNSLGKKPLDLAKNEAIKKLLLAPPKKRTSQDPPPPPRSTTIADEDEHSSLTLNLSLLGIGTVLFLATWYSYQKYKQPKAAQKSDKKEKELDKKHPIQKKK